MNSAIAISCTIPGKKQVQHTGLHCGTLCDNVYSIQSGPASYEYLTILPKQLVYLLSYWLLSTALPLYACAYHTLAGNRLQHNCISLCVAGSNAT